MTLKEYCLIIIVAEIDKDNDTVVYLLKERKNAWPLCLAGDFYQEALINVQSLGLSFLIDACYITRRFPSR